MSDETTDSGNVLDLSDVKPKRGRPKKAETPAALSNKLTESARLTVKAARATLRAVSAEMRELQAQAQKANADLERVSVEFQIGQNDLVDDESGAITRRG